MLSDDLVPPAAPQVANLVNCQPQPLVCFLSRSKPSVWVERGAALAVILSRDRERFTVMSWPRRPPQLRAATLRFVDTGSNFCSPLMKFDHSLSIAPFHLPMLQKQKLTLIQDTCHFAVLVPLGSPLWLCWLRDESSGGWE